MHDETAGNGEEIKLDHDFEQRIREYATASGDSPREVLRRAFEQYARSRPIAGTPPIRARTIFDELNEAGLIGCVDDPSLPRDLSTNKKHMEGFGRD
jgi:hypothetical protein